MSRPARVFFAALSLITLLVVAGCAHRAKRAPGIDAAHPLKTLVVELKVRLGNGLALTQLASGDGVSELFATLGDELSPALVRALGKFGFDAGFDDAASARLRALAEGANAPPLFVSTWLHPQTATVSDIRGLTGRSFFVGEAEIAKAGGEGNDYQAFAVVTLDFTDEVMYGVVHNEHALIRASIFDREGAPLFEVSAANENETVTGFPTREHDVLARRAGEAIAKLEAMPVEGF